MSARKPAALVIEIDEGDDAASVSLLIYRDGYPRQSVAINRDEFPALLAAITEATA